MAEPYPGNTGSRTWADRLHRTRGNPALLPSQRNVRLLLNSVALSSPPGAILERAGCREREAFGVGRALVLHKFAKPEADAVGSLAL